MIVCLLFFVLSVTASSIGRPHPEGNRKFSRELLHKEAEQYRRQWAPNILKFQKTWRTVPKYAQQYSGSNKRTEYSTRNRIPESSAQYYSQKNYGLMLNPQGRIAHDIKFQGIPREPPYTGYRKSFTPIKSDGSHLAFYVPKYGTDEVRGIKDKRKGLIVKVGDDEIRINPEDYEIKGEDTDTKSVVSLNENITPYQFNSLVDEPYSVVTDADNYFVTSSPDEYHLESLGPVQSPELHGSSSVDETRFSHSENSELTNQKAHELSVDRQSQAAADSRNRSLPTKPKHSEEVVQKQNFQIQEDLTTKVSKAPEYLREVIINGQLRGMHDSRSIPKHLFQLSVPAAQEPPKLMNETSEEPWKLYPPLLIEEVNLPSVKDFDSTESSDSLVIPRQILPEETVTDGSKLTTHPSEADVVKAHEPEIFQIPDFPDGSGDQLVEEERGSETEFLSIDADELIVGRNKGSNRTSVLEQEGSGLESFEDEKEDASAGHISPRIIDIFARPNDTSTPCTTPKGEPGHCKDIRYCILQEILNNFNLYLQYACLIRGRFVGVCCPDNPVITETPEPDEENSTESAMAETVEFSQPPKGCGMTTRTRIVGGVVSKPHEWNWMVALLRKNRFFCGGVLINNWYVLTAAHCTLGVKPRDLKIRLGEYDFLESREHQEDISVKEIKRHAQFITLTFQHDIALLKVKRPVQFSRFVSSICLPQALNKYSDINATVVGWGTVSFGGAASSILREVTLPVWKNEDCDRTYLLEDINDSFLCAGSSEPNQDACQGDSGGPLMALNDDGRWESIGIVSWGRRCGDPKFPGVYTRITTYLDWIQKNMT